MMQKSKTLIAFNFLPIATAFAVTIGSFTFKNVASRDIDQQTQSKKVYYAIPKTVSCAVPMIAVVAVPELWSNPATWGGTKPVAGQAVTIPANKHIILDEDTPDLAGLTINGTLEFDRKNVNLTADWIMVMGSMHIGSAALPFVQQAVITLNATNINEDVMGMGTRGLVVMGGNLEMHGTPPTKTWTKINAHTPAGSTNLSLLETVNWKVNDQIVVAPTDYLGTGATQKVAINAITGSNITTSTGMNAQRWGLLQYATTTGMSLTSGPVPTTVVLGTPTILDERAEVGNLTRNIVVQSPNDVLWQNSKFGCHIMIMRQGTTKGIAHINGIEVRRAGQNGKIGRYPFHWHMLSYDGATTLTDATGQYIRNSAIHDSAQRGIVIHGTNGVEVSKNVLFDIRGHGIFTEDASERRNVIDGNLVLNVRNPITPLKVHESGIQFGSAGFWISNPDNTITNNTVADCTAMGYWFAFTTQAWGLSIAVPMNPSRMKFGVFDGNTSHSNSSGIHFDDVESDNLGNTTGFKYVSTSDGLDPEWPYPNRLRHILSKYTTYKNAGQGIWNRAAVPDNDQVVSADNCNSFFSGAGDDGLIKRSLIVGNSLNYNMNGMTRPTTFGADHPVALASYHSTFDLKDNLIVNFPAKPNTPSGAFRLDDYYLIPVDKGLIRNVNNTLVNSHPGVRTAPHQPQFTYGVLWDANNYWSTSTSQQNYYVFDTPFFTHGQTPTIVQPNSATSGGVIATGPFYGVSDFIINKGNSPWYPLMAIQVNRLNSSLATVGTFAVAEGTNGQLLANMRHFATHPSGIYDLNFPTLNNVNDFSINISNMLTTNDYQVIGVEYNGNYQIDKLFSTTAYNYMDFGGTVPMPTSNTSDTKIYQPVTSMTAVINAPAGEVYWQDKPNNKVWFKVRGGVNPGNPSDSPISDGNLYKSFRIRAYGTFAPLSIQSNTVEQKNIVVYPNPTSLSEISLKWNNLNDNADDILIVNIQGQIVYSKQATKISGNNLLKIDVSSWTNGIYFIRIGRDAIKFVKI
jgi:hypothetical protein